MLLMIDNYDSFTYNLVQHFGELGEDVWRPYRNDEVTLDGIARLNPARVCLSPGPGGPQHAGVTLDVLREFSGKLPILGVASAIRRSARRSADASCARRPSCTAR